MKLFFCYSKLDHPNIATLIGARAYPPEYYFLYRLYEHGNLGDALHVAEWRPSLHQVLAIATQLGKSKLSPLILKQKHRTTS